MSDPGKDRWFSWTRLAGVGVTAGLFYFVFRRIDTEQLMDSAARLHAGWFALGLLAYGVALVLGGVRWHLALRAVHCRVHSGASLRLLMIGHFCYVALFGGAGGDLAKSILYARWHRYLLPEVLAAVPLDRGLGTLAALLVLGVTVLLGWWTGGFSQAAHFDWSPFMTWSLALMIVVLPLGCVLWIWRPHQDSVLGRIWRSMVGGARQLLSAGQLGWRVTLVTLVHQIVTCAVFALSLQAVSGHTLNWAQLAWTAPAVTVLSCFPITFAGAGVREIASMTLLGLYHVPAGDAVAAAMVTLVIKLAWAGLGGLVFWRESGLQSKFKNRPQPKSISVVLPTLNEESTLPATLRGLRAIPEVLELIVVDGGSTDGTRDVAARAGCSVVTSPPGRGRQLRLGAGHAAGDVILMVHADTWLPPDAGRALLDCLRDNTAVGGGFWKVFSDPHLLMRGSRFKCALRLWINRRVAADQAIFVRRADLDAIGGVPDLPLMEEFALCDRLRTRGRLALAGATVRTSARRFRQRGVIRTYLRMAMVHLRYRLGTSPEVLKRFYEKL